MTNFAVTVPETGASAFTKFVEIGQTVEGGQYVKEMGFETSSSTGTEPTSSGKNSSPLY